MLSGGESRSSRSTLGGVSAVDAGDTPPPARFPAVARTRRTIGTAIPVAGIMDRARLAEIEDGGQAEGASGGANFPDSSIVSAIVRGRYGRRSRRRTPSS